MKRFYQSSIFILLLIASATSRAQFSCDGVTYFCMENTTIYTCSGNFVDDGASNPYSDTPYTMTICPDTPGDVIQLDFVAFNLQTSANNANSDDLTIYDGDNTSESSLGTYYGTDLQNHQVTGTVLNTTGCLTIVFDPNGQANALSPGWQAIISCVTPCDPPVASSIIIDPEPLDPDTQTVSVCLNIPVTFGDNGSTAGPGFDLVQYNWDFDDGSTVSNANGADVTHSFTEPGEYLVILTVEDDNGCQNNNLEPLQVLVSTTPIFPGIAALDTGPYYTCEEVAIPAGEVESLTWTALPPQVVSGTSYLADGAGFSYSTSLVFDFFEADAVLENCDDLLSLFVNMEHSYMGDLALFVTCPDGTTVYLSEWPNSGGTLFIGEAIDIDDPNQIGVGYDYYWAPDATGGTWTEWPQNNAYGYGDSLPSGEYESEGDLCDFVGCPLNGQWTFNVTDNLGIDDGHVFYWGINFNPELYPGITTFTPSIGIDSDSSYWSGPYMTLDADADTMFIDAPDGPGAYDYTYTVVNSFGCEFDTTVTLTFQDALAISAGPDQLFSCGAVELEGSFENMPAPSCGEDGGDFTYCYTDNENFTWTFCPDDPGDGVSFMTFTFNSGQAEGCCDFITVYDGDNTGAPVIASGITNDLAGLSWTATNATGCITIQFTSDFSVACSTGLAEWNYTVECSNGGPQYTWVWDPAEFLDNPNIPSPTVETLPQTTTFTLTGYPTGHPDCATTDEVLVSIDPLGDPGLDADLLVCSTDAPFNLFNELGGNPVTTGYWTDPNGDVMADDEFDPMTDEAGEYTYNVEYANCAAYSHVTITMAGPTVIEVPNDTALCFSGSINMQLLDLDQGLEPFQYEWTYSGVSVSPAPNTTYVPQQTGTACLTVTDACDYVIQECFEVEVEQPYLALFEADTTEVCFPEYFVLHNLVDPALYQNATWEISDGTVVQNQNPYNHQFEEPGNYDVTLTLVTELGCVNTHTELNYLTSWTPPVASFQVQPQPTDALNTEIFFYDNSIGNELIYEWIFDNVNFLGYSTEVDPIFNFPLGVGGFYPVQLTVTDDHNCKDVFVFIVDIDEVFNVYIPNTFTPNGDDINEVFLVQGSDLDPKDFTLQIFNRWGDLIFESHDYTQAWTGGNELGEFFVPDGVYLWRVVANSLSTTEKKELTGTVILMR